MRASVTAFPLHRQHRLVSGIAEDLRAKQGDAATQFWRKTAKRLLQQLAASGVELAAAEHEVRGLLYAVMAQIEAEPVSASA
jgi:deoxyribodipyrimidine photolyase